MKCPITEEEQIQGEDVTGHQTSLKYPWEISQRRDESLRLSKTYTGELKEGTKGIWGRQREENKHISDGMIERM